MLCTFASIPTRCPNTYFPSNKTKLPCFAQRMIDKLKCNLKEAMHVTQDKTFVEQQDTNKARGAGTSHRERATQSKKSRAPNR